MKTNWILATAVAAVSFTAAAGAQSGKAMGKGSKGDSASMTYTGCVESVNHGAAFLLTRVDSSEPMHGDMAMKHDDMAMKSDAAKTMEREQTPVPDEKMDTMASKSFTLVGAANFSKHVGQKVSVTGSASEGAMGTKGHSVWTLSVKSLRVIAKSCS